MNKDNFKKTYRVSAIVSTYCSEKHIEGCIQDLINQTLYKNNELEIIIINSASPQNEDAIIRRYTQKYPHIVYKKTSSRESIYAAWNRGIRLASGKYITNSNTDDRHRHDALEILADTLDAAPGIVLVYADQLITATPNQTFETATPIDRFHWPEYDFSTLLEYCCVGPQPMWRKSLHDSENLYFNERLEVVGDYEFWLKAAECHQFKKIPELLGLYYRSPQQTNKEFSDRHIRNQESFSVRRAAILRRLSQAGRNSLGTHLARCSQDIQTLLDSITRDGFSGNAGRRLQHLYWTASSLLEFTGQFDAAKNIAREYFDIVNDGFLLSYQLKELTISNNTVSRDTSEQLVSVVIPAFNAEPYIEETILSVHAQSHQNIEIICVDDGSSDNTVQKIQTLSKNLPDIPMKLILQCNQGPSRARNRAIQVAKGDFILPLDADDQIAPDYIAKALETFHNESDISVVFTEAVFYGTKNKIWATEDLRLPELFCRNFLNVTALFKKSAWLDAGGYDEKLPGYEDWDLWITMASKGHRFRLIPHPLFFYRFRTNSRAANSEHKDAQKRMAIMRKHKDIYRLPSNENRHLLGQFKRIAPQLIHPDWAYRTGIATNEGKPALRSAAPKTPQKKISTESAPSKG